jgi:hypothetical protein
LIINFSFAFNSEAHSLVIQPALTFFNSHFYFSSWDNPTLSSIQPQQQQQQPSGQQTWPSKKLPPGFAEGNRIAPTTAAAGMAAAIAALPAGLAGWRARHNLSN